MIPYLFFGFHIFKDYNVTFMCQYYLNSSPSSIIELALKSYYTKSDRVLKSFFNMNIFSMLFIEYDY